MKTKKLIAGVIGAVVLILAGVLVHLNTSIEIAFESDFEDNSVIEYTGEDIQFPMAYVAKGTGKIVSYDVNYEVVNLADNSILEDKYATFNLKCGEYKFVCTYEDNSLIKREVAFTVQDTLSPGIEFTNIPNGVFLQDIEEGESPKLPLYTIEDASMDDGIELEKTLYFMGEEDADYKAYDYKEINNSYMPQAFGKFKYVLVATDIHGNKTEAAAEWKIKDRTWKPEEIAEGYLADYSSEGYTNLIESGDANQYYKIGDDYKDLWYEEFEGAKGVLEIDMGFNNATGRGSNVIKLHFAENFTKKDIDGKYLAVRMYVDAENLDEEFLMSGNIVELRDDQVTRAFYSQITGLETGKWMTYYIDAETVQNIGVYDNSKYNSATTFYQGGDEASAIQLCFFRKAGFSNRMKLYVDSITLAEKLPETVVTVNDSTASWNAVDGAVGYKVNVNGVETIVEDTKFSLNEEVGYVRVIPLGDGALTLDGEEAVAVFGLDAGSNLASFDSELYIELFSEKLNFSSDAEHFGYKPKTMTGTYTDPGVTLELGTGEWGVCTGTKILFPQAKAKGTNTTLELNMSISNAKYRVMRVYDYDGEFLGEIQLTSENTGKFHNFQIDLSGYDKAMKGVQLLFGPSANLVNVPEGVTLKFQNIRYLNTYYDIEVNGKILTCVGEKILIPGYTQDDLVQFTGVYDFGVPENDTVLGFEGKVRLDGRFLKASEFQVVGYPDSDVICFKVAHEGKILTIDKGSIIYYGDKAVVVGETFNGQWTGNGYIWEMIEKVPDEPPKVFITIDGEKYEVIYSVILKPGHTQKDLVQFLNVYDFEVPKDNTPLGFKGKILLDGKELRDCDYSVYGYPGVTTITLNVFHDGKVLTVMEGSYIYYDGEAIEVEETFNAKWDGSKWKEVAKIPDPPEPEYIKLADGTEKEVVARVELTPGHTADTLVQFTNVYNFELPKDDTPLGFEGTVLIDGVKVNPTVVGYKRTATICFKDIMHKNKVLTIMEGSVIYYKDDAVVVDETFNATWNGSKWKNVSKIPPTPDPVYIEVDGKQKEVVAKVKLTPGHTQADLVQFINVYNLGVAADNTPLGFKGTVLLDGAEVNNPTILGYKGSTTICLNGVLHTNKVLTVMKDSVIYYGDKAVVVEETFNAKWNGTSWTTVAQIPAAPPKEYVTVDGVQKEVVDKVTLTPGHTATTLVQFINVYDFGATADNTSLGFSGTVLLDGVEVNNPSVLGYKGSTTVCLNNIVHKDKVLTVMKDSVIYYGNKAVVVAENFNAKWDGSVWTPVAEIPTPPAKEYVTIGEEQKEVVAKVNLTAGFTTESLVQFTNVYDFEVAADDTALGFEGTVLLDGVEVENPTVVGYAGNPTICLNNVVHKDKVLTVMKDSVIYSGDKAVVVAENFNAKWDGSTWTTVTEIPTPPSEVSFTYRWGAANVLQVNTDLPSTTPCKDFLATDNGCNIDQSGNQYQQFGYVGMANADGTIVLTFNFGSNFEAGQTYVLPEGAVFGFTDGKTYTLDKAYTFTFDGTDWTEGEITPEGPSEVSFTYRWGNGNTLQVNTDLPSTTPCADFLATDNGCNINQSGNQYQQFGYVGMANADGTIVLTFNFGSNFEAGQTYVLPEGAVFGFTDGKTYTLDKDYTFTFNGTDWTEGEVTPEEPVEVSFAYRWGAANALQVNTDLPSDTPIANFTATDNGCSLSQSGNQSVGWIGMADADGTIVLTFNFNNAFEANQTYVIEEGSVFGFTDGKTYTLDKDYTFTFNGSDWALS